MEQRKIEVVHFQRKPRAGENFSLEFIFNNVRMYLAEKVDFRVVVVRFESNGFLKRVKNIIYAKKYQGAVNHVTGDIHYISLLFSKRRTILTILDCGFMNSDSRLKRFIFLWFWLKIPVWKSSHITTISEASKRDIIMYTGCPADKIEVIPVAVSEIYKPVPKEFNEECPVLLQIGTAYNKNLERLFEAIASIHCKLVIVGKLDERKLHLLKEYDIAFENKTNLTDEEVYLEYQKCDLVTFVSTYEGFGMPIIEANWVERPIIAGNNSSMIQVANDAALLVDAHSVADIRNGILSLISNGLLRHELIERGRQNRTLYSGQQLAERYYALYRQVYNDNGPTK
jgi:glycosyltransferase involved in cell wall biosynthesis